MIDAINFLTQCIHHIKNYRNLHSGELTIKNIIIEINHYGQDIFLLTVLKNLSCGNSKQPFNFSTGSALPVAADIVKI